MGGDPAAHLTCGRRVLGGQSAAGADIVVAALLVGTDAEGGAGTDIPTTPDRLPVWDDESFVQVNMSAIATLSDSPTCLSAAPVVCHPSCAALQASVAA